MSSTGELVTAAVAEAAGDHVTWPQTFRTAPTVTVAIRPSAPPEHMLRSHSETICLGIQSEDGPDHTHVEAKLQI